MEEREKLTQDSEIRSRNGIAGRGKIMTGFHKINGFWFRFWNRSFYQSTQQDCPILFFDTDRDRQMNGWRERRQSNSPNIYVLFLYFSLSFFLTVQPWLAPTLPLSNFPRLLPLNKSIFIFIFSLLPMRPCHSQSVN